MDRNAIREALFSSKNRRSKRVKLPLGEGEIEVEIRQPTVAVRSEIMKAMKLGRGGEIVDVEAAEQGKWLAIQKCAFDLDGNALFDKADRDSVLAQPDWFDALASECIGILTPSQKQAEEVEGN